MQIKILFPFLIVSTIFGQIPFTIHEVSSVPTSTKSIYAIDIDGDEDIDILSASYSDNLISWYENNGSQTFTAHTIATDANEAWDVYAADVDKDGDIDVLSASSKDGTIAWYENNGSQNFTKHVITDKLSNNSNGMSVYTIDMDGDGDIDVVSASAGANGLGGVNWYENNGSQSFTAKVIEGTEASRDAFPFDIDKDGDIDVVAGNYGMSVYWYENNGSESFTRHEITTPNSDLYKRSNNTTSVYAIDIDGDGDIDIIGASKDDDKVSWYENDGSQSFTPHTITTSADGANAIYALDLDSDGDIDVLSASDDPGSGVEWYENNGSEYFTVRTIANNQSYILRNGSNYTIFGNSDVFAIDLDKDGYIDVLSDGLAGGNSGTNIDVVWYENGTDITAPTVTSVSSTADNGTYGIGSVIPITVTFSESVIVTGTPQLTLETGDTDVVVDYSSGSGSSILTFNYTVASGHVSNDLEVVNENALALNSGTIKDAAENDATLTFPIANCCIGINKAIVIDGIVPAIVSTAFTSPAGNDHLTVTFSEGIYNTNGGSGGVEKEDFNITLTQNSGTVTAVTISSIYSDDFFAAVAPVGGETSISFNLDLTGTASGVESIMITPKSASVYDIAGNDASTIAQGNNSVVLKDKLPPAITSVSLASDNSTIAVTFSEAVYNTNSGSGALEANDFSISIAPFLSSGEVTTGVLSSNTPSSISADGNIYTLGISFTTPSKGGDTLYVRYRDDSIYDAVGNEIAKDIVGTQVGVNYFAILNDVVPPVISSTAPNQNSYVNHTKVSYSLDDAAASGTITWTRTGGSADSNSPHAQALAGDELNTGAHTDITLTNNPTLVEGAIYTISFDAKDLGGNAATTISNTAITYDASAPTISSILPAASSYVNHARVSYTLSEAIASGTVTWTRTGGSEDTNSPYAKALSGDELNTGAHTDITLTNSPTLIDGAIYTVSFGATDFAGNSATTVSTTGITYDVSAPAISSTSPSENSYVNNTKVSYTLSEAVANGTITWTRTGGSEDSNSPHAKALAGIELNSGAHTDITLTNNPTLVDAMYTVSFDATDVAGNAATTVSASNVTYDFTAPTLLKVTPAADSFLPIADNSKIRIDFSEPITAYNVDASSKLGTNLNTSIQQASDSLVISVNAPLTSLDTLTFKLTNITDRAGSVGDSILVSYHTSVLADYNNDYKVDIQDLANFVSLWPNLDLGPANGTIPYLTPEIDGQTNLRDVGVFTRMWHWSYANNGASSKVFVSMGEPISIDHLSDKISISIPDHAIAGEIILEYLKSDIDLGLSDEMTENRIVISNQDPDYGLLSVNFGYLKDIQSKELVFSVNHKATSNSNFTINYVFYDESNTVLNMGSQEIDIKAIPLEYALHENYPNPFNPTTTLRFDLPNVSDINLTIYNMLGQKVKTFNMQNTPAGFHSLIWNATNDYGDPVSAGIYLYQLQAKGFVKTRKMVLLK